MLTHYIHYLSQYSWHSYTAIVLCLTGLVAFVLVFFIRDAESKEFVRWLGSCFLTIGFLTSLILAYRSHEEISVKEYRQLIQWTKEDPKFQQTVAEKLAGKQVFSQFDYFMLSLEHQEHQREIYKATLLNGGQ